MRVDTRPLSVQELWAMADALPDTLKGKRDVAILLLAYAAQLSRAELVALNLEHVTFGLTSMRIEVACPDRRKGPRTVNVDGRQKSYNPCSSLKRWVDACSIHSGPLFRPINRHGQAGNTRLCDKAVGLIAKEAARVAGLDPTQVGADSLTLGLRQERLTYYHVTTDTANLVKRRLMCAVDGKLANTQGAKLRFDGDKVRLFIREVLRSGTQSWSRIDNLVSAEFDCEPSTAARWRKRIGFIGRFADEKSEGSCVVNHGNTSGRRNKTARTKSGNIGSEFTC